MNLNEMILIMVMLLPGICLMAKSEEKLYQELLKDTNIPSYSLRLFNHIILSYPFAFLGLFFYKIVGSEVFTIEALNRYSLSLSLLCALIHVAVYYFYFRKNVENETFTKVEKTRQQIGIVTRTLYGGVVEEIIFRFGMMSFFVWVCNFFIEDVDLSIWTANILASILFALAHLPGVYQMKVPVTKTIYLYTTSMNVMVGVFCGWLYWKEGLLAAIMCHMLFHLVWYVFEIMVPILPKKKIV
jgi:membrane protease YdiL (CAAX protease family)